jgi:hypothetical protein
MFMDQPVVLSYSYKDIRQVRRLRQALQLHGLPVWPDQTLMPGTPAWKRDVQSRLQAAACVILILSKNTLFSNWVLQVIAYARDHDLPVLPVVVDGDPGHILLVELEGDLWFDLRWSRNYVVEVRALVAQIQQVMKQSVIPL